MLIEAGDYYYKFNPEMNVFKTGVNLSIPVTDFETNDSRLDEWVSNDGGIVFCKAANSPDNRPGDTSWGLIPLNSTNKSCGCNGSGWAGYGAFYGGTSSQCTSCGCQGGGWSGTRGNGENKGLGGYKNVDLRIYVN